MKPYLHAEHILSWDHVLEDDCRPQNAVRVQCKLLLFIASEDGEGKRGAIVKRVFVCHYQLQNACAHWFIFLYTYTQRIKKRIKMIHIAIIKYHILLSRIFNWMLSAQAGISQAAVFWHRLRPMDRRQRWRHSPHLQGLLNSVWYSVWSGLTKSQDSQPEQGVKKSELIPEQTFWG